MRINTNIAALNSYNQLNNTQNNLSKSLERLSSGKRINGASDDAAGLAISEKMTGQTRGLGQAQRNAQDAISMNQTAEGALKESHSILQRMRELAVQSANDTNTEQDRAEIQKEVDELASELTRISNNTEFNTQTLLNGAIQEDNVGDAVFQIGSNEDQNINLNVNAMDAESLGVADDVDVFEAENVVDLTNVEIDDVDNTGDAISDGETISLGSYEAGTSDTAAEITGSGSASLGDLASGDEISIDYTDANGEVQSITADLSSASDMDGVVSAINSGVSGDDIATNDGGELQLTSQGTGRNQEVDVTSVTTSGSADLGVDDTDSAEGTSEADTIEVSNGSGDSQYVEVDGSGTEFSVSDGDFAGISGELDSAADFDNLTGNEAFDVSQTTEDSTSATFTADGELDSEAVAAAGIDVSSQDTANTAISTIDEAIENVSAERSKLGAYQNRLDHTINNLNTAEENLTAAESRISDVDMAEEMMGFTKNQILSQAGTAMMAQANQLPQGVLQLLG